MNLTHERLIKNLEKLELSHMGEVLDSVAEEAASKEASYSEFLALLLEAELASRKERSILMRTRTAGFPFIKTSRPLSSPFSPRSTRRGCASSRLCALSRA